MKFQLINDTWESINWIMLLFYIRFRMGMLDIFFFLQRKCSSAVGESSDHQISLDLSVNKLAPRERAWCLLRKSALSLKTLMLSLDSTVSCVTLMMLGDLSGPQLPLLKCWHQGKPAQTSPQDMASFKLWKKNHLYKDRKSPHSSAFIGPRLWWRGKAA